MTQSDIPSAGHEREDPGARTVSELAQIIRSRHSERVPFDPDRAPSEADLEALLEAASMRCCHS